MQITTCSPRTPAPGRKPGPLATSACPTKRGKPHLSSAASSTLTETPGPGRAAQLSALAARLASHLAVAIKTMLPVHFHQMQSSENGERLKSEFKLLFTRSQYFHKIILLREGVDYQNPRWPKVALWGLWDGGDKNKEAKPWNHTHSPLKIHMHLFISQVSMESLPGAPGTLSRQWGCTIKGD